MGFALAVAVIFQLHAATIVAVCVFAAILVILGVAALVRLFFEKDEHDLRLKKGKCSYL